MVFDSMAKLVKYFWLVCLTTWSAPLHQHLCVERSILTICGDNESLNDGTKFVKNKTKQNKYFFSPVI